MDWGALLSAVLTAYGPTGLLLVIAGLFLFGVRHLPENLRAIQGPLTQQMELLHQIAQGQSAHLELLRQIATDLRESQRLLHEGQLQQAQDMYRLIGLLTPRTHPVE